MSLSMLLLVLYCEKKHGSGKELADFSKQSVIQAPRWARHGVIYQVFPRVYTHQGTFHALQRKLDYIHQLNVDIIWLMPIYPIGEKGRKGSLGSPFSVKDFRKVNPEYGTDADFRNLVDAIHQKGMKVIIGMVPNHASNDNVLMKEHPDWFMRDEQGNFTREVADWSDITDFNYDNPEMRRYMKETLIYWVKEFDVDGFRCDVAGMVPYDFWKDALAELRKVKPDIYLLAEWEDPRILLAGFNSDYDWTLYHLLKEIRSGKKRTVEAVNLIAQKDSLYPRNALPMRFLENHDEQRSLFVFGPQAIEAYATFIFTAPGIPLIYAGQEIGETEKPSLFEKSELHWAEADTALLNMYRSLIRLRKAYGCFTGGDFIPLPAALLSGSAAAFLREDESSAALVVCNLRKAPARQVIFTLPESVRNRLKELSLVNYKNPADKISLKTVYFKEIPAFTTQVYVAEK